MLLVKMGLGVVISVSLSALKNDSSLLYVIIIMPKEEKRPRNRKVKHNRDKNFAPLSKEEIEKIERQARG